VADAFLKISPNQQKMVFPNTIRISWLENNQLRLKKPNEIQINSKK
jgi:hypothetical protein